MANPSASGREVIGSQLHLHTRIHNRRINVQTNLKEIHQIIKPFNFSPAKQKQYFDNNNANTLKTHLSNIKI